MLLLTEEKLRDADWPRDSIDAFFYIRRDMPHADIRKGAAHLARSERIDRIVALDDFDVELAAMLREHLFVPGMGETTGAPFRDKLAMRRRARSAGIPCPDFVHVLNDEAINEWTSRVPAPWVVKPRSQAAAIGIRKLHSSEELWSASTRSATPARSIYSSNSSPATSFTSTPSCSTIDVRFAVASRYEMPPMVVAHEAGIFVTRTLPAERSERRRARTLQRARPEILRTASRCLTHGVHSRPRRRLAVSGDLGARRWSLHRRRGRSGNRHQSVARMGARRNRRRGWRVRSAVAPELCGGIVLSLARQETPDLSAYTDPEIVIRVRKRHHAGLIVTSPDSERVVQLLEDYTGGSTSISTRPPRRRNAQPIDQGARP